MSAIPLPSLENSRENQFDWTKSPNIGRYKPHESHSDSGKISNALLDKIQRDKIRTITTPPDDVRLERELADIQQECSVPDWNGYGAKPIDRSSIQHVCKFLGMLPEGISYPELCAEPNGDLAMVWQKHGYHIAVGIDGDGRIAWGGTGPGGRIFGDAKFSNDMPKVILDMLYSIEGNR